MSQMKNTYIKWTVAWSLLAVTLLKVEGAGQVYIGYPSFINSTSPTKFIFSVNTLNPVIPVYIQAFNDSQPTVPVPITNDVSVTCETSIIADGFSSGRFQSVLLTSANNYTDIPVSNLLSGRVVDVRCFGETRAPPPVTTPPQFTNATSISDPVQMQVKSAPSVNFCESRFLVPDEATPNNYKFELEFSEAVVGGIDNLNLRCLITNLTTSPAPALDININTTEAYPKDVLRNDTFVLLPVPYTIQTKGSAISVQCLAQSITGTQYLFNNSAGTASQFEMETGSVHLYPEYPEFIQTTSPIIKTVLYLDSPVTSDDPVLFMCQANLENNTQDAMLKAQTPDCSFTIEAITTTTTAAPTTPSNVTLPPTEDVTNRSLWEVTPSMVEFQAGRVYRSLEILRTVDVTDPELELVLLTCCAPSAINDNPKYINQSVTLLTSVYLQPSRINWTLATTSDQAFVERSIPNPAYVEVAPCACDMTGGACDVNCCCDQDCTEIQTSTFSSCISGLGGGLSAPSPTHFCNSTHIYKDDWFKLMCVEFQSSADLGLFFTSQASARNIQSFNSKLSSAKSDYNFRETTRRNVAETGVGTAGYKYGQRVKTAQPTATGGLSARSGILTLPRRTIGGHCLSNSPVRFLKDFVSDCTYQVSRQLCSADSVLSAKMYAQATGLTSPPCPQSYQVLSVEDSSGKAVSTAQANYFCSSSNTGFLNTPDTMSRNLDPYTRSLFNYNLPSESCQDIFGNDICSDPEIIQVSPESAIPRCPFDDGFTQPPEPSFNTTANTCQNAVLSVHYNFTWSGQRIVFLNTTVVLGDLPLTVEWQENRTVTYTDINGTVHQNVTLVDFSAAATLTQQYTSLFHHNYTNLTDNGNSSSTTERIDRSGYPGYDGGKPVHSGKAIINTTSDTFYYVNSNLSNQMTLFQTGFDGLCYNAGRRRVTFQDDAVSNCIIQLGFDDLDNCTSLRKLILNRLNNMMSADRLGRFGFLNSNNEGYWVSVIRQDLTEYFTYYPPPNVTVDLPRNETNFTLATDLTGICSNVTSGIHLEILYGETGKTLGASILEIVGAKISYSVDTWNLKCSGTSSPRCYRNDTSGETEVESFFLTTSVRFTRVPANIPDAPILFWQGYDATLCPEDSCWHGLFYPLTEEYTGEQPFYTFAWTLIMVIVFLFYFMITRPWW